MIKFITKIEALLKVLFKKGKDFEALTCIDEFSSGKTSVSVSSGPLSKDEYSVVKDIIMNSYAKHLAVFPHYVMLSDYKNTGIKLKVSNIHLRSEK